jgi:BNR repeat-like domain
MEVQMSPKPTAKFFMVCVCLLFLTFSGARMIVAFSSAAFQPQTPLGSSLPGDQWEPAIAADAHGHVYVLIPDFPPGCKGCPSSIMYLVTSSDNGATWSVPQRIRTTAGPLPDGSGQIDVQIKVDPVHGRTVYASWLQNNKSVIEVAKSTDFGATWTTVIANQTDAGTDKDILVVKGNDVYVGYNHAQTVWVSSSHDGGQTFSSAKVNQNAQFGWSLTGGAAIDKSNNVYFAWDGYTQNGQATGPVNLYVTKSSDGGATWTSTLLDVSGSPPVCSAFFCGWAFLGPGIAMTSDKAGQLYVFWNAGPVDPDQGPERIWYSTSKDEGHSWSTKADVSLAPQGVDHAFPAVAAGAAGDVRIAWMDQRNTPHWNVYYRSSLDGGTTWSGETQLSSSVQGPTYILSDGFRFPFGDYFGLAIDNLGRTQAAWGEGFNWLTPGNVWYTRQLR